ncbi:MAG: DNA replication and repair protein RecF [Bacteroidia bacterium]|nr:DNA replication and repair protein RecF [Bacteroidia bacterium]
MNSLYISHLSLMQFRSYSDLALEFSPAVNCFTGINGSGKTNLLDAVHFIALTRGFRSHQDQQAIQEGTDFCFNTATVHREGETLAVSCNLMRGRGKKMLINQRPLDKMSDHIGRIPLIAILPGDTDLIHGSAGDRRSLLDQLISQYDRRYLHHLIQYERIRAQRNALLKQFQLQRSFHEDQIEIWDVQLIPNGIYLREARAAFLESFQPVFSRFFHRIVSESETPEIQYKTQLEDNRPEAWEALLRARRERDRVLGYSTGGIHRDDLEFFIDGRTVREYGSQGQKKTFVIALKLAQYELLAQRSGLPPLLLLDDLFDRLDEARLGRIAAILDDTATGQVFITDTSQERLARVMSGHLGRELRFFSVSRGQVAAG